LSALDLRPSKTQRKRKMQWLQRLGEQIAALAPARVEALHLPDELQAAVEQCRGIRSREARRRHMQYLGVLMRQLPEAEVVRLARCLGVGDFHGFVLGEVVEPMDGKAEGVARDHFETDAADVLAFGDASQRSDSRR
jgi:hypothetical protein